MNLPQTKVPSLKPLIDYLQDLEDSVTCFKPNVIDSIEGTLCKLSVGNKAYPLLVELDEYFEKMSKLIDGTDSLRQVLEERTAILKRVLLAELPPDSQGLFQGKNVHYGRDRYGSYHILAPKLQVCGS